MQFPPSLCYKSYMNYKPVGESPLLYRPGVDKVMNLDQETFEDTVFNSSLPVLVEVYKDWCGHCRKFLPIFREFSYSVQNWNESVQVAVVNCADLHNRKVCNSTRGFGKSTVPSMKYFHAHSSDYSDSFEFDPAHTVEAMRAALVEKMTEQMPENDSLVVSAVEMDDDHCDSLKKVAKEVWRQTSAPSVNYVVLVVAEEGDDNHTNLATQLKLDLSPYKEKVDVLSLKSPSNAAELLEVKQTPSVVLLKKGSEKPVFAGQINLNTSLELVKLAELAPLGSQSPNLMEKKVKPKIIDCKKEPEHCKELYYVSERDMLKALKVALYNEILNEDTTEGKDFDNLKNFLQLLVDNFPTSTKRNAPRESATTALKSSEKAHQFFKHMLGFLESKQDRKFSADEWNTTFLANEEKDKPFPKKSDEYEHCHGSSVEYRGFTCGLWSAFHTLTVNSYLNAKQQQSTSKNSKGQNGEVVGEDDSTMASTALKPLKAIQGWIYSFFSCEHCRKHFMNMTTVEFPMDKSKVRKPEDAFMYFWEAHNLVNKHLHGDMTEDPQFTKYQFPPSFLCSSCTKADGKQVDKENVQKFLLEYYTNIKPHH